MLSEDNGGDIMEFVHWGLLKFCAGPWAIHISEGTTILQFIITNP